MKLFTYIDIFPYKVVAAIPALCQVRNPFYRSPSYCSFKDEFWEEYGASLSADLVGTTLQSIGNITSFQSLVISSSKLPTVSYLR